MLSLVNYSDDESASEASDEETGSIPVIVEQKPAKNGTKQPETPEPTITEETLLATLPKVASKDIQEIEEEKDEFLEKGAEIRRKLQQKKPRETVKIAIPSLRSFVGDELEGKSSLKVRGNDASVGLLKMLPRPKKEMASLGLKPAQTSNPSEGLKPSTKPLIPDSVKRAALIPDSVKKAQLAKKTANKPEDSDSDDETDFFSLNKEKALPDVTANEISLLVAKKAAEIAKRKSQMLEEELNRPPPPIEIPTVEELMKAPPSSDSLIKITGGNRAKRTRTLENITFLDISDADIRPDADEFKRSRLASQTQFIPTGQLTGYDSTSKRKSQITFLAQKAVANEQELQAMWSANRQKQRASSSKYGF